MLVHIKNAPIELFPLINVSNNIILTFFTLLILTMLSERDNWLGMAKTLPMMSLVMLVPEVMLDNKDIR